MLSDWVGVLYRGRLVEEGICSQVMSDPQHGYTRRLIASLPVPDPAEQASKEAEYRAVAEALRKEPGFASAEYKGNQVFAVDYRITSKLTHGFVFPLNIDARMVIPFVAIELRGNDRVRVIAPSFANDRSQSGGQLGEAMPMTRASRLDGSFTLTTDAEIVSQNNEEGVSGSGAAKTISWRVTPQRKEAPTAVLKLAPL